MAKSFEGGEGGGSFGKHESWEFFMGAMVLPFLFLGFAFE